MKNWSVEDENGESSCPLSEECLDAEKIARKLGIDFEIVVSDSMLLIR